MTPLDLYCERCGPGLWAEPLNAVTNLSFLMAAFFAGQLAVRKSCQTLEISSAIALAVAVGVGSAVFHTAATVWAKWLDVVPILLLQCWFVWLYSCRIMKLRSVSAIGLLTLLVVGGGMLGDRFAEVLNGSLGYLPAFLILAGMGLWHLRQQKTEPYLLLFATGALFIALVFRTIDQLVCPMLPIGTHFLWHLFNGGTVYLTLRCLILNLPRPGVSEEVWPQEIR